MMSRCATIATTFFRPADHLRVPSGQGVDSLALTVCLPSTTG